MKIVVCGKGGAGKSTVTTLLAKSYADDGKRVLVIDGDESNFGLAQMLGKEQPKEYIESMGGKMKMMPILANAPFDIPKLFANPWTMDDLPEGSSPEPGQIKIMNIGKIHNENEGCACVFNTVLAQLIENLQLNANDVVLIDMEAGIEHFGRGTDNSADVIVMVIDPTAESIKLAGKVHQITDSMGKPVFYALNKVEDDDRDFIESAIDDASLIAVEIPYSRDLRKSGLEGSELSDDDIEVDALIAKIAAAAA